MNNTDTLEDLAAAAQATYRPRFRPRPRSGPGPLVVFGGLALGFCGLVALVAGTSTGGPQPAQAEAHEAPVVARLVPDTGGTRVAVAVTERDWVLYNRLRGENLVGLEAFFLNGGAVVVAPGTRCRVLVRRDGLAQVEVADGQFAGRVGWVSEQSLR